MRKLASGVAITGLFLLLLLPRAHGESVVPPTGHNLFTTTYTLPADRNWVVGNYYLGRALNSNAMVATSPWIWINYNMANLDLKAGGPVLSNGDRLSLEATAFYSLTPRWANYGQESIFLRTTFSHEFSAHYICHLGGGYQYFWNDDSAYSLRPRPWNRDRYTFSAGALHEIRLNEISGVFLETGILGLNYKLPFFHLGASYHYSFSWGFVQLGISTSFRKAVTVPPAPLPFTAERDAWDATYLEDPYSDYWIYKNDGISPQPIADRRWLVHPEIQIQIPL